MAEGGEGIGRGGEWYGGEWNKEKEKGGGEEVKGRIKGEEKK